MGMIETKSIIIMIILKTSRMESISQEKIFFLRLYLLVKFLFSRIRFRVVGIEKTKSNREKSTAAILSLYFRKLIPFLFHFAAGTYPIRIIYFFLMKDIMDILHYIAGI